MKSRGGVAGSAHPARTPDRIAPDFGDICANSSSRAHMHGRDHGIDVVIATPIARSRTGGQVNDAGPRGILAGMPELIGEPTQVAAAGEPPKVIEEYVGRANTGEARLSVAHMRSPAGWAEPGQRPEFDEFTIVLYGALVVDY